LEKRKAQEKGNPQVGKKEGDIRRKTVNAHFTRKSSRKAAGATITPVSRVWSKGGER